MCAEGLSCTTPLGHQPPYLAGSASQYSLMSRGEVCLFPDTLVSPDSLGLEVELLSKGKILEKEKQARGLSPLLGELRNLLSVVGLVSTYSIRTQDKSISSQFFTFNYLWLEWSGLSLS